MPYKNAEDRRRHERGLSAERKAALAEYKREYRKTHKEKISKQRRDYRKNNPGYEKDRLLRYFYGISKEQYNELYIIQKGCCSICGRHQSEFKKSLFVDHDHETGKVRGLLCYSCNTILGMAHDNIDLLKNTIDYLERYNNYVRK